MAQRQKKLHGSDVHAGFEGNHRSVGYGKQCMLVWYDVQVLGRALEFEVESQRKKGRLKRTWKKQVEEESVKVGLRREDALCRSKWSVGVNQIAAG